MTTANAINCLTGVKNSCQLNSFNESVPKCSLLKDKVSCEFSYGCFFDNDDNCKEINADYCTLPDVVNSHLLCRRDQNDFCYFNKETNTCSVCNQDVSKDKQDMKLISMDGTKCMDWNLGCQPYYQRNGHPACRKYCEFTEQPDNTTYTCTDCKTIQAHVAIDGQCLNSEQCSNRGASYRKAMRSNYTKAVNNIYDNRLSCTISISQSLDYELTILDGKFDNTIQYQGQDNERTSICPQNYKKVDYQPLKVGESGPRLTGTNENAVSTVNQIISKRCECPPGFYIDVNDSNACKECMEGTTTYKADQHQCGPICTENQVVALDGSCQASCGDNQEVQARGQSNMCVECQVGNILIDQKCQPVPKSYYLPLNRGVSRSANIEIKRCDNGMTTEDIGSYSELQCSKSCQVGQVVDIDGECHANCAQGAYLEGQYCKVCDEGNQREGDVCQPCPKGTYKPMLHALCIKCAGAYTTTSTGSISITNCNVPCDVAVNNAGECVTSCQDGEAIIDGHCTACGANEYVSADGMECVTQCGQGEELTNNRCQKCAAGYYKPDAGNGACTQCPTGQISVNYISCDGCGPGKVPVNNVCTDCSDNQFVSNDYATCVNQCGNGEGPANRHCEPCPSGKYSANGQCQDCPAGQISTQGQSSCTACTGATAPSQDKSTCVACEGQTPYLKEDKTQCVASCSLGEKPNNNVCEKCPQGTYGTGSECVSCTGNEYQDQIGATSCKNCTTNNPIIQNTHNIGCQTTCQHGQEWNGSQCVSCPAGTYSSNGVECSACTGLGYSAAGSSNCDNCTNNKLPNENHDSCVDCDGFIQIQDDGNYKCQSSCNSDYGVIGDSKICQICPEGNKIENSKCVPCPAMTYFDHDAKQCIKCPENGFSAEGSTKCTLCVAPTPYVNQFGTQCVAQCGVSLFLRGGQCIQCPAGKVSQGVHNLACTTCQPMTYAEGAQRCEPCSVGAWSIAGQTQCTDCLQGYISADKNECVITCPADQLANEKMRSCERCSLGQYVSNGECKPCGDGFQVSIDGLGCKKCPDNTISNEKTGFKCSLCESGLVLSADGTECSKACGRNQQPNTVKITVDQATGTIVEGLQCEKCPIGYQSIDGTKCVFVQSSYQQAINQAQQQSTKKILVIVLPIIAALLIIGAVLTFVFVRKLKKKNALKTARNAYGTRKTVAISALQTRRQVDSVI